MALNVYGLVAMLVFYILIFILGILAARMAKKKRGGGSMTENSEEMILAGRGTGLVIGVFTITATWVDGGLINGTVEQIYKNGLLWCQAPFGYALSLVVGGLFFAHRMRDQGYMTMLDPLQQRFGARMCGLLFLPSLLGEIFWAGAILNALGATVSVIVAIDPKTSIIISTVVAMIYTVAGGLYSVMYTDMIQLPFMFLALWICVPYSMHNPSVGSLSCRSTDWLGTIEPRLIGQYVDNALLLILGGVPWQDYLQRVLSARSSMQARLLSYIGALGTVMMIIPPVLLGVVGKATRWNETTYTGPVPLDEEHQALLLPLVLQHLTPWYISFLGMGAIAAAVLSSADSSLLSAGAMFGRNVYQPIFRKNASEREVVWIIRITIILIGVASGATAIAVDSVYGLYFLSSDLVYVILFPQLVAAVFLKNHCNTYGAVLGYFTGFVLRILGGEPMLGIPVVIKYPYYNRVQGQLFPFRTFSMVMSFVVLISVSCVTQFLFVRNFIPRRLDIFGCFKNVKEHPSDTGLSTFEPAGRSNEDVLHGIKSNGLSETDCQLLNRR